MRKTLAEIAKFVKGEVVGDEKMVITGINTIDHAGQGELTFVANSKYYPLIKTTQASAILTPRDLDVPGKSFIRTDNPSLAFAQIASLILEKEVTPPKLKGIHKTAVVAKDAKLAKDVALGPYVVIEGKVKIGKGTVIQAGSYVGHETTIGEGCTIYPHVTIRERVSIGNQVAIHSGTVLGCDGFGYEMVDGVHQKIPQLGTVVIEDNVEIGANVTIDRARFHKTVIGKGTKIDNLVQIAHNVIVGENCIIISQVGISGSVVLGKGVILAGQAGISGHITIGDGAVVASQSGVAKSIPAHTKVFGYPAKPHMEAKRMYASIERLPEYIKTIQQLEKRIGELEKKISSS
jgi:UDP-3-O-[3-hydroxymyristoyl] glucosamine N-acyltransferase